MGRLMTVCPGLIQDASQLGRRLGRAHREQDLALVPDTHAVNRHPDAEGPAGMLRPVRPNPGVAKDVGEHLTLDDVVLAGRWREQAAPLGLPALLLGSLELEALLGLTDELRLHQPRQCRLDLL